MLVQADRHDAEAREAGERYRELEVAYDRGREDVAEARYFHPKLERGKQQQEQGGYFLPTHYTHLSKEVLFVQINSGPHFELVCHPPPWER